MELTITSGVKTRTHTHSTSLKHTFRFKMTVTGKSPPVIQTKRIHLHNPKAAHALSITFPMNSQVTVSLKLNPTS